MKEKEGKDNDRNKKERKPKKIKKRRKYGCLNMYESKLLNESKNVFTLA